MLTTASMRSRPRVTVLQPDELVPLDRFHDWLHPTVSLEIHRLWEQPVPTFAELGDGLLILGGRGDALDTERSPWLPAVMTLLRDAVAASLPTLGICLGHQILACAFDGSVQAPATGQDEEGAATLSWTDAASSDPVLGALAATGRGIVAESHNDAVTQLPSRAVLLASSTRCVVQAMRIGSALGVQFHPEVSPRRMELWANGHGGDGAAMRHEMEAVDDEVAASGRCIAERFIATVTAHAGI